MEPPNYGPQPARFGPRCSSCEFYDHETANCAKYSVQVKHYFACDSWKRNPSLPIKAV